MFSRQTRTWSINPSIMQMSHKFSVQVNKVNKFGHKSSTIITCTTVMIMTFGATENKRYRKEPITNPQHRRQPVINRHFTDSSGSKVSKFVEAKVISFPFSLPKQNKKKIMKCALHQKVNSMSPGQVREPSDPHLTVLRLRVTQQKFE